MICYYKSFRFNFTYLRLNFGKSLDVKLNHFLRLRFIGIAFAEAIPLNLCKCYFLIMILTAEVMKEFLDKCPDDFEIFFKNTPVTDTVEISVSEKKIILKSD